MFFNILIWIMNQIFSDSFLAFINAFVFFYKKKIIE